MINQQLLLLASPSSVYLAARVPIAGSQGAGDRAADGGSKQDMYLASSYPYACCGNGS